MRMCTSSELLNSVVLFFLEARNDPVAEMSIKRLKDLSGVYHIPPPPPLHQPRRMLNAHIVNCVGLTWTHRARCCPELHPSALICSNLSKPKA